MTRGLRGVGIEDALQNGGMCRSSGNFSIFREHLSTDREHAIEYVIATECLCGFPAENAFRDQTGRERNIRNCGGAKCNASIDVFNTRKMDS